MAFLLFTILGLLQLMPQGVGGFVTGADVSWVSMQEKNGVAFYNAAGQKTDLFVLLKALKLNAVRLRVWVNPSGGWCDGGDTLYKAKRAQAQGLKIMIDFHYSDSWADPGQQNPPAAWSSHSLTQLNTDVYQHTQGILKYLKDNGITAVDWVQVGNEINGGMLWPTGDVRNNKNFNNLAQLLNSGYNAVKAVYPSAKVIVHLAKGLDNSLFQWFFDGVQKNGGKWDITGMSHYPTLDGASANDWQSKNAQLSTTMSNMVKRYAKPVMVVEVGMPWDQAANAQNMLADLVKRVKALGDSNGLGVFYWEPQAYPGYQGYQWGAMDNSGKFTAAMNALKN